MFSLKKDDQLAEAVRAFAPGSCRCMPLGNGNINDTYLIEHQGLTDSRFVLQRINSRVFPQPVKVIHNFQTVSIHIQASRNYNPDLLRVAQPVFTCEGGLHYCDSQGGLWRGQSYFDNFIPVSCNSSGGGAELGRSLAGLHRYLKDLDPDAIDDPLPGFHELDLYLQRFDRAIAARRDLIENQELRFCLEYIEKTRVRALALIEAFKAGILPRQTIHGDPKNDNFLVQPASRAIAVIDLDTVRPGCIQLDIGDCLRSIGNRGGEADSGQAVELDMAVCRDFLAGYLSVAGQQLAAPQRSYFFDAFLGIAFELGVRFLTDHLEGDTYFKVRWRGENLQRAVRQFQLAGKISAGENEFRKMLR